MSNGKKWKDGDVLNTTTQLNEMLPAAFASINGGSGLTLLIEAITYLDNFVKKVFAGGTIAIGAGLTDHAVWVDSAQALQQGASFPGSGSFIALALVTTNGTDIVSITQVLQLSGAGVSAGGGGGAPTGPAGGDLSGTYPSPSVGTVGGTAAAVVGAHPASNANPHSVTAIQSGALPITDAVLVPAPSKVPKSDGLGKIDLGWLPPIPVTEIPSGNTTQGMAVLLSTLLEVGPFTDVTAEATSEAGSTFSTLLSVAGNTVFFGSDFRFSGVEVNTQTFIDLGSAVLTWEYWDGAAWVMFSTMESRAIPGPNLPIDPLESFGNTPFRNTGLNNIRFPSVMLAPTGILGQQLKAVNGLNKFWVRVRNSSGILTQNAVIEHVKIHTSHTKYHATGQAEYFGFAMPSVVLAKVDIQPLEVSGNNPANGTVGMSATISVFFPKLRFNDGAVDSSPLWVRFFQGLNTSEPLVLRVVYLVQSANAGDIDFKTVSILVPAVSPAGGGPVGSLPEVVKNKIVTSPGAEQDVPRVVTQTIDISDLVNDDSMLTVLTRDASAGNANDTLAANIVVMSVTIEGKRWL